MKTPLLLTAALVLSLGSQAQIKDLKKSSDLGQKLFGNSNAVELKFENNYDLDRQWNYSAKFDDPTAEARVEIYTFHTNIADSTMMMEQGGEDIKKFHDAKVGGMLTVSEGNGIECLEVRRPLEEMRSKAFVFSETEEIAIVNGWKCKMYLCETEYHIFKVWMNADEETGAMLGQMAILTNVGTLGAPSLPSGIMIKFEKIRKVSDKVELSVELNDEFVHGLSFPANQCWTADDSEAPEQD